MEGRRGKQKEKYEAHIKSLDFYKYYTAKYLFYYIKTRKFVNRESFYYVDYTTYNLVLDRFNELLRDEIIYKSFEFSMPARMGLLKIGKTKTEPYINKEGEFINNLPVDWNSTIALWESDSEAKANKKLIRHTNEITKGYIAKWKYSVFQATYRWKNVYKFIPCRTAKVKLAKAIKDPNISVDYYLL